MKEKKMFNINRLVVVVITVMVGVVMGNNEKVVATLYSFINHGFVFSFMVNQFNFIEFQYPMNLNATYTMLEQITVDNKWNLIADNINVTLNNESTLMCSKMRKQISFYPDTTINYTFYSIDHRRIKQYPKHFALGRSFDDADLNIIHQLYNDNIISYRRFAFVHNNYTHILRNEDDDEYNFYFGGFPLAIRSSFRGDNLIKCKQHQQHSIPWLCYISKIYLINNNTKRINNTNNNNAYEYNNNVYWNSMSYYMTIPISFKDYLKQNVFNNAITNDICVYKESSSFKGSFLTCDCNIMDTLPNLRFVFSDISNKGIEIEFKHLFTQHTKSFIEHQYCELMMKVDNTNGDTFAFGTQFMRMFDIEFDYEGDEVLMYSEKYINNNNNNVINNIKTLIIINIMLNSIMCVLIYLLKHVSTTNNEQQQ